MNTQQNTTPKEPTVADLHRINKQLDDEKRMLTEKLFEADQKIQSQAARIEKLENKLPVVKNSYIANPDGGLPVWMPAVICFVFALIGLGAAHYAMKIIAVLLGVWGAA